MQAIVHAIELIVGRQRGLGEAAHTPLQRVAGLRRHARHSRQVAGAAWRAGARERGAGERGDQALLLRHREATHVLGGRGRAAAGQRPRGGVPGFAAGIAARQQVAEHRDGLGVVELAGGPDRGGPRLLERLAHGAGRVARRGQLRAHAGQRHGGLRELEATEVLGGPEARADRAAPERLDERAPQVLLARRRRLVAHPPVQLAGITAIEAVEHQLARGLVGRLATDPQQ